jgi:cysteine-rich repeat protein
LFDCVIRAHTTQHDRTGDGTVNNGNPFDPGDPRPALEECDDGNTDPNDGCDAVCITEFCGDGINNLPAEECDDGNTVEDDGCSMGCLTTDPANPTRDECGAACLNGEVPAGPPNASTNAGPSGPFNASLVPAAAADTACSLCVGISAHPVADTAMGFLSLFQGQVHVCFVWCLAEL